LGKATCDVSNLAAGTYSFGASFAGDTNNGSAAATNISNYQVKLGTPAPLSITGLNSSYTYGAGAITLSTTGGSTNGAVTYTSSDQTVASVSDNKVTILKAGTFRITATKAADANYAETTATFDVTVNKADQKPLSITGLNNSYTYGDPVFALGTTGGSGTGGVTFTSSNTAVATISGNKVTICGAGTFTITAAQAGDNNYNAASVTSGIITVNKAAQTSFSITGLNSSYTYGDAAFTIGTTGGSGTGAVTFMSSDPTIVSIVDNVATILKAGSFIITATKAASGNYAEERATFDVTINKAVPSMILSATGGAGMNDDVVLTATVSKVGTGIMPTGSVTFKEGETTLDVTSLNSSGIATCTIAAPVPAGAHTFTAEYAGDGDHYATAGAAPSAIFIIYTAIDAANAPSVIVYSQHDDLIVKSDATIQRIMVYNISGQLIKEVKPGSGYIEISGLPKTQVLVVNVMVDGKTGSYKVQIEK